MSESKSFSRLECNGLPISLDMIFHPFFLQENTFFNSFNEFLKAAKISSSSELESKSISELDAITTNLTEYKSWLELLTAAQDDWKRRNKCE